MKLLTEGLDHLDLDGMVEPIVSVDEYSAHMGTDDQIVTMAFIIRSEAAGNDLADWFERGYDWVLDAQISEGELSPGKYLVFVEMNRRSTVPERLIELLEDLKTLTDIDVKDWTIRYNEEDYPAEPDVLSKVMTLVPMKYRDEEEDKDGATEEGLNEVRVAAGLPVKRLYTNQDATLKAYKALAGL
jgi:hypothetical protein